MDNEQVLKLATVAGIIFLCIGFFWIGFANGYNYVKEHKDNYINKMCICKEKEDISLDYLPEELKDFKLYQT